MEKTMQDPAQLLKTQIGELIWNNAALVGRINELEAQLKTYQDADDSKTKVKK